MISENSTLRLPQPYLLFLGDETDPREAKTAFGLKDWVPEQCLGELVLTPNTVSTGLPRMSAVEARAKGARALVIGIANDGGYVAQHWVPALVEALAAGLDLISGLHSKLVSHPDIAAAAQRYGRQLIDIRTPPANVRVATGRKRTGQRILTVGTDCALGKKYTALSLAQSLRARNHKATFRATGQTGILIAGGGIPMDAMVADFVAGAAEMLSPDNEADHWDVIEGQGSVFHPSYAGVSLGLLHGSQPDVIVLCHAAGRDRVLGLESFATPSLAEAIDLHLRLARRTNPAVRCAGVSLNTSGLTPIRAREELAKHARELKLPVADPIRGGSEFDELVSACLEGRA